MTIKVKRGSRAALNALAGSGSLVVGQPILIEDEARLAVATGVSTYSAMAKQSEAGGGGGGGGRSLGQIRHSVRSRL